MSPIAYTRRPAGVVVDICVITGAGVAVEAGVAIGSGVCVHEMVLYCEGSGDSDLRCSCRRSCDAGVDGGGIICSYEDSIGIWIPHKHNNNRYCKQSDVQTEPRTYQRSATLYYIRDCISPYNHCIQPDNQRQDRVDHYYI